MPLPALTLRIPKGAPLTPGEMDGNLQMIADFINGLEQRMNVSIGPDGSINTDAVTGSVEDKLSIKVGDLIFSAALLNDDVSRLLCDGSEVSRTTYADLFAAVGSTYGAPSSSQNFVLPDYRAKFPVGVGTFGSGAGAALGVGGGEEKHGLSVAELPSHTHGITIGAGVINSGGTADGPLATSPTSTIHLNETPWTGAGSGTAHNTLPPYVPCYIYVRTGLAP